MQSQQWPQVTPQGTLELVGSSEFPKLRQEALPMCFSMGQSLDSGLTLATDLLEGAGVRASVLKGVLGGAPSIHYTSLFMSKDVFPTCLFTSPWPALHLISISKPFIGNGSGDTRIAFD